MGLLGRILWVAQVWLTAAATLVAGFPQLACACPGSQTASPGPVLPGAGMLLRRRLSDVRRPRRLLP
jgi:hypothetical protein